jgi:hypothetical protein
LEQGRPRGAPSNICGFDDPTDQVNVTVEPLALGPLQDNGGPTMTHALGADGVAIHVIQEAECRSVVNTKALSAQFLTRHNTSTAQFGASLELGGLRERQINAV